MKKSHLKNELQRISDACHHDPFTILGRHQDGKDVVVRAFIPSANEVKIAEGGIPLTRLPGTDHPRKSSQPTNHRQIAAS